MQEAEKQREHEMSLAKKNAKKKELVAGVGENDPYPRDDYVEISSWETRY